MTEPRKRDRFDAQLLLKPDSSESANTTGEAVHAVPAPEVAAVVVAISDVSGTDPTLDLTLQGSHDGNDWYDLVKAPTLAAAGKYQAAVGPQSCSYYRYVSEIGGTNGPAFTYLVMLTS